MKAYFNWIELRPDSREFRMNSTVLEPQNFIVVVDVPDTAEYLENYVEIANAQLTNQPVPEPLFTFAAAQYCLKQAEKYFSADIVNPGDFKSNFKPDDEGDEWEEPAKEKSTKASDDDTWEEDIDTDDKDEKWDEDTENWEEEK